MSQTVDNRIVEMQFDNKDFEKNVAVSLTTLDKLKNSIINLEEASKNLKGLSEVTKGFDFTSISNGIQDIGQKLSSIKNLEVFEFLNQMGEVASKVFHKIGDAYDSTLGKAVGIASQKGWARAENLEQAKFQVEGILKDAKLTKAIVDAANEAVTDTAYGLDEAAVVASQFAATGIKDSKVMSKYLRGVAGVAAMGGKSFTEVGHVFTTVAGQGRVMATQLNQLATYGVNAAATMADEFGVTEAEIREMVSKGKVSFEMFAEAMDSAFGEHAKDANKTFNGAMANMKAALGRIGEAFATPYRQNAIPVLNETKQLINAIKLRLGPFVKMWEKFAEFLSGSLVDKIKAATKFIKEDMNFVRLENAATNVLFGFLKIIYSIRDAFRDAFPKGKWMINDLLLVVEKVSEKFAAFANILSIVIKPVLTVILKGITGLGTAVKAIIRSMTPGISLFKTVGAALLNVLKTIVALNVYIVRHIDLNKIWNVVLGSVSSVINVVKSAFVGLIAAAKNGSNVIGKITKSFTTFLKTAGGTVLKVLVGAVLSVINAFKKLKNIDFSKLQNGIINVYDKIKVFVSSIKDIPAVSKAIDNVRFAFEKLRNFFVGFVNSIGTFFSSFSNRSTSFTRTVVSETSTIEKVLNGLTTTLKILGGAAGTVLMILLNTFNAIFDKIRSFNFEAVTDWIKNFTEAFKSLNFVESIKTVVTSGGSFVDVLKVIIEKIKEFISNIKEGNTNLDFFTEKIQKLIQFLADLKDKIYSSLFGDQLTRGGGGTGLGSTLDTLKDKFEVFKTKALEGLAKLRESGLMTKILMAAYAAGIINALIKIPNSISRVTKSMEEGSGLFGTIKEFTGNLNNFFVGLNGNIARGNGLLASLIESVKKWGEAQEKSKLELFAETFRSIAISIVILAGSLMMLTLVDANKLKTVAWTIGILGGALILISGAITAFSAKNIINDSFFRSFAINMLAMTTAIVILASAMAILASIDTNIAKAGIAIVILAGLMIGMYALTTAMAKLDITGATLRSSLFIVSFALATKLIARALVQLATIPVESLSYNFFDTLIFLIAGFGAFALACSQVKVSNALGAVILLIVFEKLFNYLRTLTDMDWDGLADRVTEWKDELTLIFIVVTAILAYVRIRLAMIFSVLAKTLAQLGKSVAMMGLGFLAIGAGLLLMAGAIKKLAKIDWQTDGATILKGLVSIVAVFTAMLVVMRIVDNTSSDVKGAFLKVAGAFALLSLAIIQISLASLLMKMVKWPDLLKSLTAMATLIVGMAMILSAAKGSEHLGFKPILGMILGLITLVGSLVILSLMAGNPTVWENTKKALVIITALMLEMSLLMMQISKINTGQSWKPILMVTLMLVALVGGLYLLSTQIKSGAELGFLIGAAATIGILLGAIIKMTEKFLEFAKKANAGQGKYVVKSLAMLGIMIGAFIVVAGSLIALSLVGANLGELAGYALAITLTIAILGQCAIALTKAMKKVKWGEMAKAGAAMLGMVAILASVAGALMLLNFININDGFVVKVIALGLVIAELTGLFLLLNKFGNASLKTVGALAGLTAMVGIFALLAVVFKLISGLPVDGMLPKSQILVLTLLELTVIFAILGALGGNALQGLLGAVGLTAMVGIFALLALIFKLISELPLKGMLAKSQILILTLFELAVIYEVMGVLGATSALGLVGVIGLAAMVAIFGLLTIIFELISDLPLEGILAKSQILVLTLFELAVIYEIMGVLGATSALGLIGVVGLAAMVAIFGLLAIIFDIISTLPLEGMLAKSQILMLVMTEMAAILLIMGTLGALSAGGLAGAAGLLVIALALVPLAAALKMLEGIAFEQLSGGLLALATGLGILLAAGLIAGFVAPGLFALAGAIVLLGVAVLAAGFGVQMFADALMQLGSMGPAQLAMLQATIMTFFTSVSVGVMQFGQSILVTITTIGMGIVTTVNMVIMGLVMAIANGLTMMAAVITSQGTMVTAAVVALVASLPGDIVNAIVQSLSSVGGRVFEAGKALGSKIVAGFRKATGWNSPPEFLVKFFKDAGVAVNENAEGITDLFEGTGEDWGSALSKSLSNTVDNFDWSKIGSFISDQIGEGFDISDILKQINSLTGMDIGGYVAKEKKRLTSDWAMGRISYEEMKKQKAELESTNGIIEQIADSAANAADGMNGLGESFDGAGSSASGAKDKIAELGDTLLSTLTGQMNIFDKFESKDPMSPDQMLENMHSQIDGMTAWAANMNKLAERGIDEGLLQKLAELGPEGGDKVAAFVNMTDEQLKEASTLWGQSLALPRQVTDMLMYDLKTTGANMGKNLMAGEASGIEENTSLTTDQMTEAQKKTEDAGNEYNIIQSPSKLYWRMGMYIMEGLRNGIRDTQHEVFGAMRFVCEQLALIAKNNLSSDKFRQYGANVVDGILEGLESKSAALETAMSKLAKKSTIKPYTKDTEIESPSKVFYRFGQYIVEGLSLGINNSAHRVEESMHDLADTSMDSMRNTISGIAKMVEDGVDDPVITPILDLSQVTAGANRLNNLFSTNQALAVSGSMENLQNGKSIGGTTFIQNNYSPKALTRADIYRQTRNQFAQYRQATL